MRPGLIILILLIVLIVLVVHRQSRKMAEQVIQPAVLINESSRPVSSGAVASSVSSKQAFPPITHGEHSVTLANGRKYLLYVPRSYRSETTVPLILFFHGGGGWMEQAAADYGWEEKAEKEGFIMVFPNGSSRSPRQHLATWNAGNCCGYARDAKIDDVAFARMVVMDVESQVNVDAKRVFATGMSNGGMLSHRLACEAADLFTAVASVAGTDGVGALCQPSRPISVMHIHARDDDHVLFTGGADEEAFGLVNKSSIADFTSVPDTIKLWIERDHANPVPKRVLEVPGAYVDRYTSSENNAVIELVVTETGGHSWPGGKAVRGKQPSQAIRADDVIWDFFLAQSKN